MNCIRVAISICGFTVEVEGGAGLELEQGWSWSRAGAGAGLTTGPEYIYEPSFWSADGV